VTVFLCLCAGCAVAGAGHASARGGQAAGCASDRTSAPPQPRGRTARRGGGRYQATEGARDAVSQKCGEMTAAPSSCECRLHCFAHPHARLLIRTQALAARLRQAESSADDHALELSTVTAPLMAQVWRGFKAKHLYRLLDGSLSCVVASYMCRSRRCSSRTTCCGATWRPPRRGPPCAPR